MIRHCVMLQLELEFDTVQLTLIIEGLGTLVDELDGCDGFCSGLNRDFEGKSQGFRAGFTFDARDAKALAAYAAHPTHKMLGSQLVDLCKGGGDGIMVFDLEVDPA